MMSEGGADQVQSYTYNKMLLEKELFVSARQHDAEYVVLRPTFIYGPFNYAPRESYYIKKIIDVYKRQGQNTLFWIRLW